MLRAEKSVLAAGVELIGGPKGPKAKQGVRAPQIWPGLTKYSVIWYPCLVFPYGVDHKTLHFWYHLT